MSPYAMKHLRRKLVTKTKKFANGAIDLALEAAFLSSLDHPNILKIHGVASDGPDAYARGRHDSFFIIVDRLHETLQDRIVTWRKQHKHLKSAWGRMTDKKGKKQDKLMADRLKVAFHIASALNYLHSRGLLYRDLKPTNIGFGLDDEVKLFDFGLCRELPVGADHSMSAVYDMSGGVGTYR
jgi:serine/threonine protein kinase